MPTSPCLSVFKFHFNDRKGEILIGAMPFAFDVAFIKSIDVTHIISLLPESQRLQDAEEAIKKEGMVLTHFPMEDHQPPVSIAFVQEVIEHIDRLVSIGASVYVHCWASLGRAPTIVACYLLKRGRPLDDVKESLEEARGQIVPETEEQRAFVAEFARLVIAGEV